MVTPRRHKVSGFTLLEMGVVVAVSAVLVLGAVTGLRGYLQAARLERTAREMVGLLGATVNSATRQLTFTTGCTPAAPCTTMEPIKTYLGAALQPGGRCFDLSGSGWGGASAPHESMRVALGGASGIPNEGRTAFESPIAVCLYSRRVEVSSCVPLDDVPFDFGGAAAGPCHASLNAAGCSDGLRCVAVSKVLVPPNMSRLAMNYKYLYWGEATRSP